MRFRKLLRFATQILDRLRPATERSDVPAQSSDIARRAKLGNIVELLPAALSRPTRAQDAAANCIARLLGSTPSADLLRLDQIVRKSLGAWPMLSWHSLKPSELASLSDRPHGSVLLGIASFHCNGHVREEAVRLLSEIRNGGELGFLLVRTSDWVPTIRTAAHAASLERIDHKHAPELIRFLPLFFALEQRERSRADSLVPQLLEVLRHPASRTALVDGLRNPDHGVSRACLRIVEGMERTTKLELLRLARNSQDPAVRFLANVQLLESTESGELRALYAEVLRDPSARVRLVCIRAAAEQQFSDTDTLLADALMDRSGGVREAARFYLLRRGVSDFRECYLRWIDTVPASKQSIALLGLGETGQREDFERVRPFLDSATPSVRKAALAAASRLAPEKATPYLDAALESAHPGIVRTACRALGANPRSISTERLTSLALGHVLPHVRRNALSLICRLGKWERIAPLLAATADPDPGIRRSVCSAIERWLATFNRSWTKPTSAEQSAILDAFAKYRSNLSPRLIAEIEFLLKS